MYEEILELEKYCNKIGVVTEKVGLLDGWCLYFNNGGDVVQHSGSYGSKNGCVEFGYTGFTLDFKAMSLKDAKGFVRHRKDSLNNKVGGRRGK